MQLKRTDSARSAPSNVRLPQQSAPASSRHGVEATDRAEPFDKRQVFKRMVVGSLESSFLRYSKRKSLLDYAAKIGISEFDAMLLIAEAQFYADEIEPANQDDSWLLKDPPRIEVWSTTTKLLLAVGIAAVIDTALICWLFA